MTRGSSKLAFWLFAFVSQLKLGPVCAERRQPSARPLQAAAWGHDVAPSASTVILLQVTSRRTSTEGSSMLALLPACVVVAIGAAVVFAVLRPYLKGKESAKIALAAGLVAHHMEGFRRRCSLFGFAARCAQNGHGQWILRSVVCDAA
mmetsp:Transcript_147749/g.472819  ORF Transcript_147749/g.472819 Transcript_147749/m.472819 type:complete len:148 (-) Transcript_147749:756-1199(-)